MFETHIVPYSFDSDVLYMPSVQVRLAPGQAQGVYIMLHPDNVDDIEDKLQQWFEARPEVSIVDVGTSDKQGIGFIILEWMECAIDPLFIAILQGEEFVADYSLYIRHLQISEGA